MKKLFTERHGLTEPRIKEELDPDLKKGLLNVISAKIDQHLFGAPFSEECPDGQGSVGCDKGKLVAGLAAYKVISPYGWPIQGEEWPSDPQLFDLVEFLYEHAGLPHAYSHHSYWGHDPLGQKTHSGPKKSMAGNDVRILGVSAGTPFPQTLRTHRISVP